MTQFYKVAGLTVSMDTFGRTLEQAAPYLCEPCETCDIELMSTLEKSRPFYQKDWPDVTDSDVEYMTSGFQFYRKLLNFDGMMLHSSAVVVDGKAYLFSATSGTGKSTHTQLWLKMFGDRAFILNDDKPALRLIDGVWYAFGTPWSGKHDISVNTGVPVAGIVMVERAEENEITPWSGKDAIFAIFTQVNRPRDMEFRVKLLELLDKLITQVPVWKLRCNMDPDAARVSYQAMSARRKDENQRN